MTAYGIFVDGKWNWTTNKRVALKCHAKALSLGLKSEVRAIPGYVRADYPAGFDAPTFRVLSDRIA